MTVRSAFPFEVVETEDMGIVMSDGVRLSARVWMPRDAGMNPVPAVLEYIPYRKRDGTLPRDEMMHPYFAGHGYAAVRVDMRGNGDSEGLMTDEYTIQELADACEVIEWLAAQPWCSGAVGMMGKSWGGFNCLQTAFLQPPALKAVVSVCSTSDRFADDIHYKGGCLLGENFGWGAVMLSYSSRPPDPLLRPDWREMWLARLEAEPWLAPRWAEFQEKSDYWKHGSIGEDWAQNIVPIQVWGGWADNYMNTVAKIVGNVPGAKGIVGPWVHQYPHTAVPGPKVGFLDEALRWWDRWLKGVDNGADADPAYRVWMMESEAPDASAKARAGRWVAGGLDEGVSRQVLRLTPGGFAPPGPPAGYLGKDESLGVIASPQHLGMDAGEFFPMGLNAEMPGDQAADDAFSLCFDGSVLGEPLALMGAARLSLRLSSDKPLGFVVARLCDVAPDGSSVRIAHGMLNLCHRDSMEEPSRLVPGQAYDLAFDLDQMAYRVAKGHHLRLALSNAYWPFVWPSPEAGRLTVEAGSLDLPVHQGGGAWEPPPAQHAKPWAHEVLRPAKTTRKVERDLITGSRAMVVVDDLGDVKNLAHGLCTGETMTERWEIGEGPLSAVATHTWEQRLSRGDWQVRTEAWAEMTATATHLRMRARLVAHEGAVEVFRRDWDDTVERRFV
ncbi:CocE/NonD family hydrolase [Stagnihabitans tardus]|uniref:CocE/NonD family hydrolase n=1 Tax=Stagnihabitans tardus TaxID=2699202 RepID=A0AAE4Y8M2_9RHOB|nr:CocE/NonD family hydrolase [Stagnihabitans tardus]NBZ87197.1 CocE/NonD family hydrolase [Stagnihabitans tardus]